MENDAIWPSIWVHKFRCPLFLKTSVHRCVPRLNFFGCFVLEVWTKISGNTVGAQHLAISIKTWTKTHLRKTRHNNFIWHLAIIHQTHNYQVLQKNIKCHLKQHMQLLSTLFSFQYFLIKNGFKFFISNYRWFMRIQVKYQVKWIHIKFWRHKFLCCGD